MQKIVSILEKIIFWLILFLFAFIPLYPKFPLINVHGTFVAIRIEDLVIALALGLWFVYMIFSNRLITLLKSNLVQAILLFFFIGGVSTFSAIFLTHSVTPILSILNFLRRVEFMVLLPVVATIVKSKKQLKIILVSLSLVVLLVNIYGLGQIYLGWKVISTTNSEFSKGLILSLSPGGRVNSTFAGHYDLAIFLAMTLAILTALFFYVKKSLKIYIVFLGAISLFVLIMTTARLSFVAAFIGLIAVLILTKRHKYILLLLLFFAAILIYPSQLRDRFISTITVNIFHQGQRYQGKTDDQKARSKLNIPTLAVKTSSISANTSTFATQSGVATDITPGEPIDSTELGVYRSFEIRLNIEWPRAIIAFIKDPLLGTGYSSIDIATDNDFLRSLGEVGLLGTIALCLVIFEAAKRIFSILKSSNRMFRYFSAGMLSMLVVFLVNGLFIDVFEASKVASLFWMMLGLNLAILGFKND